MSSHPCPQCATAARHVGRIPVASHFAGRLLDEPLPPNSLYRCGSCHLVFVHPVPDRDELNDLYRQGAEDTWTHGAVVRADWTLALEWLAGLEPGARVLDVGCFDGNFLSRLPAGIERFGIEPQASAAAAAEEAHGVSVIADDFAALAGLDEKFEVITCFDVIEHVHEPAELLRTLARALAPGGRLVVGTGNADAPTWRLMGSRYWYCWFPEHIAFISPRWCRAIAPTLGLVVQRIEPHSRRLGTAPFAVEAAKNAAYRVMPLGLARRIRGARLHKHGIDNPSAATSPPMWFAARDHILVELRRA